MNDAVTMGLLEGVGDLNGVIERLRQGQWSLPQPFRQRLALKALQHEEVGPVVLADIVQHADVRVLQGCDSSRFAQETAAALRLLLQLRGQNLDGDDTIEAG